VAIAVGSRGIAQLDSMVKATVDFLKANGNSPFIVPAMGSHGGATAEGQAQVLASYGITPETMGCPVISSMDTHRLQEHPGAPAVFIDLAAWKADGIVLINRVKPHTDFHGRWESGLVKMAVIGLGKKNQASEVHRHGVRGLRELIPDAFQQILGTGKLWAGLAVVENAYDETAHVEVLPAGRFSSRESELLELARGNMPRLPFDDLDVLIVDRVGKDISGSGMDTNIIGRIRISGEVEPEAPRIRSIMVSRLTEATHGNATGLGLADVITQGLFDEIDFVTTYANIVTSGFLERGKIPVVAKNDREALEIALRAAVPFSSETATIIRIRDTLHCHEMMVSAAAAQRMQDLSLGSVQENSLPLFDPAGSLCPWT